MKVFVDQRDVNYSFNYLVDLSFFTYLGNYLKVVCEKGYAYMYVYICIYVYSN